MIYRFPDRTVDLLLEQPGFGDVSEDDRYSAAFILLDGLLGEATRLRWIGGVEIVAEFSAEQRARATSIIHLPAHLEALNEDD